VHNQTLPQYGLFLISAALPEQVSVPCKGASKKKISVFSASLKKSFTFALGISHLADGLTEVHLFVVPVFLIPGGQSLVVAPFSSLVWIHSSFYCVCRKIHAR
jgi:hypothetical protein